MLRGLRDRQQPGIIRGGHGPRPRPLLPKPDPERTSTSAPQPGSAYYYELAGPSGEAVATGVECYPGTFLCVADAPNDSRALIELPYGDELTEIAVLARDVHAYDVSKRGVAAPNFLCWGDDEAPRALVIEEFDGRHGKLACHSAQRGFLPEYRLPSFVVAEKVSTLPAAPTELNHAFHFQYPSWDVPLVTGPLRGPHAVELTTIDPRKPVEPLTESTPTIATNVDPEVIRLLSKLQALAYRKPGPDRALHVAVPATGLDVHVHDHVSEFVTMDIPEGVLFIVDEGPDRGLWVARAK